MTDFFISYNKADRSWAEWIAWQLEDTGSSSLLQAWDFRPGSNFVLEMQKASAQSRRTIVVLSPDYRTAQFTQPEWAAAFEKDPTGQLRTLVPVKVRECILEGLLPQITYINLIGLAEPAARNELLNEVRADRTKPATPPVFPGPVAQSDPVKPPYPSSGRSNHLLFRDAGDDLGTRLAPMHGSARKLSLSVQGDPALITVIDAGLAPDRPDLVDDYAEELWLGIQRDEQYRRILEALFQKGQFELAQSLVDRLMLSIDRDRYHAKIVDIAK